MEKQGRKKEREESLVKNKEQKKESKRSSKKEEDVERNGIIPEGMDFKKFLGCGG